MIKLVNVYTDGKAQESVVEMLYELLLERPQEANISHSKMPTYAEHEAFVATIPYEHWYAIIAHQTTVGAVSATRQNELGIGILKAHQRQGYAASALTQFMLDHKPLPAVPSLRRGTWLANVAPGNPASHALFRALGGKIIQTTYQI